MRNVLRFWVRAVLIGCLLSLAACQAKIHGTINPDGSSKMELSAKLPALSQLVNTFKPEAHSTPAGAEAALVGAMQQAFSHFEGCEAWSNATYREDKTYSYFTLTGYFRDWSKINSTLSGVVGDPPGTGSGSTINPDGKWILTLHSATLTEDDPHAPQKPVSPETVQQSIELARSMQDGLRQGLAQIQMFIDQIPAESGITEEIDVGGAIVKAEGDFVIQSKSVATNFQPFKELIATFKNALDDEKVAAAFIRVSMQKNVSVSGPQPLDLETKHLLVSFFKANKPSMLVSDRLTIVPGPPAFNYAAEVKKALADPGPLITRLKQGEGRSDPPAPSAEPSATATPPKGK